LVLLYFQTAPRSSIQTACGVPHPSIRANPIKLSHRTSRQGNYLFTAIYQRAACINLHLPRHCRSSTTQCATLHHTAPHCTTLQRTSASDVPVQAALSNDNTVGLQTSSEHLQSARWAASLLAPATVEDLDPPETQGSAQVAVLHDV